MSDVRVCAISDTHGLLPDIPPCDILLIAGDVTPVHDHDLNFQASWLTTNFKKWLKDAPAKYIIGLAGNHDFALEAFSEIGPDLPWIYLLDSGEEVMGLNIYGYPWVPNLPRWAFYKDDAGLKDAADKVPKDTNILMTHGPPRGFGDRVKYRKWGEGPNVGDPNTTNASDRVKPRLHVFGHIHEDRGEWTLSFPESSTRTLANVSMRDEMYQTVGRKPMEWRL